MRFLLFVLCFAALAYIAANADTPRLAVPPKWSVPEKAQASAMAVPSPEPMPKKVLAVVLCNNVVGLGVIDDTGEWHSYHVESEEQVNSVLHMVPADQTISMNLGCPSDASKDTTVL